jgi:hypothetical protein
MEDDPVRRAYDWAASFRSDLDKKNIFEGVGVYQAVEQGFQSIPLEEGLAEFTPAAATAYDALHEANEAALTEVKKGQDPNDNQWKTAVVDKLKQLADAFLATDPDPPPQDVEMAGGKKRRRKTRKRKTRKGKSRRARYSRRR